MKRRPNETESEWVDRLFHQSWFEKYGLWLVPVLALSGVWVILFCELLHHLFGWGMGISHASR